MKHTEHKSRKSFKQWSMPNQRTAPEPAKNVHHKTKSHMEPTRMLSNPPAFIRIIKGHNRLLPRDVGRSRKQTRIPSKGRVIPNA